MNGALQLLSRPERARWRHDFAFTPSSTRVLAAAGLMLAGGLLVGCDGRDTSELSPQREAAVAETIRSLVTVGPYPDPEPYLQLYREDAPFYSEGSRLSRSEHEAAVHEHVSDPSKVEVQASEPEVEVLGPRAAVASIVLRGHVTDTAGERRKVSGAITQVYELRDGEWKVVQAHESFAPGGVLLVRSISAGAGEETRSFGSVPHPLFAGAHDGSPSGEQPFLAAEKGSSFPFDLVACTPGLHPIEGPAPPPRFVERAPVGCYWRRSEGDREGIPRRTLQGFPEGRLEGTCGFNLIRGSQEAEVAIRVAFIDPRSLTLPRI